MAGRALEPAATDATGSGTTLERAAAGAALPALLDTLPACFAACSAALRTALASARDPTTTLDTSPRDTAGMEACVREVTAARTIAPR